MDKPRFDAEFDDFYTQCLKDLQARPNYTDAFIPMLERYVTLSAKLSKLNSEIVDEEVTAEHTNKAKEKNTVSSPKLRMFLALNREANIMAKELGLSPTSAPAKLDGKGKRKGFDLGPGEMKVA